MKTSKLSILVVIAIASAIALTVTWFFQGPTRSDARLLQENTAIQSGKHIAQIPVPPIRDPNARTSQRTSHPSPALNQVASRLDSQPRTKLAETDLEIVIGVFGSLEPLDGPAELSQSGGIHFYRSNDVNRSANVVYNTTTNKYGVWSKELVLKGALPDIKAISSDFDVTIVTYSDQLVILRAGARFDLNRDYVQLTRYQGVDSVEPDIVYAKLITM